MTTITPQPPAVEVDFTDADLTSQGGELFVARMAQRLGLPDALAESIRVKQRQRGPSDAAHLLGLIYNLAGGHGHLADLDALAEDPVRRSVLGGDAVPTSRRTGEYLARFDAASVAALADVARRTTAQVLPAVAHHEVSRRGYVPVFLDGTAIEVDGDLFEGAAKGYNGERQYWLHNVFVGGLWASGRLQPGGVDVAGGWAEQLARDVAGALPAEAPVWARADFAYYRRSVVHALREAGWDYSISVTNADCKRPVLETVEGLGEDAWTDIGSGEQATLAVHRPAGWNHDAAYVIVRTPLEGAQQPLFHRHTVILVSRTDLPLAALVHHHRAKQGQENAFKGPLQEMDLHHPPCRAFRANQAFYLCGQLAQTLLVAVQHFALPTEARRHGLRPLIRHLVRTAARLVRSGRRLRLDFAKSAFRVDWLYMAGCQLE